MAQDTTPRRPKSIPKIDFSAMPLYPLQREIRDHPAVYKVVAVGRQAGKSFLAKQIALDEAGNKGKNVWWIAPTYGAARSHWIELLKMLEGFPVKHLDRSNKEIQFWSGGILTIKSADRPDNLRGTSLDYAILDEAAFMTEEVWYRIIQPMLTATRGRALIISTPQGKNWFWRTYRLAFNPEYADYYHAWTAPSHASPYQDAASLALIRRTVPDRVWREEYLAEFISDSGGVFTKTEAAAVAKRQTRRTNPLMRVSVGIDWGQDFDYTTITGVDMDTRQQLFGERFTALEPEQQIERIIEIYNTWLPNEVFIEVNGMGGTMYKLLRNAFLKTERHVDEFDMETGDTRYASFRYGGTRFTAVLFNNILKRQYVERLSAAIEFKDIDLLEEADEYGAIQLSEMSVYQRERTIRNFTITYNAPEGEHDDTIIALMLAWSGVKYVPGMSKDEQQNRVVKMAGKAQKSPFSKSWVKGKGKR